MMENLHFSGVSPSISVRPRFCATTLAIAHPVYKEDENSRLEISTFRLGPPRHREGGSQAFGDGARWSRGAGDDPPCRGLKLLERKESASPSPRPCRQVCRRRLPFTTTTTTTTTTTASPLHHAAEEAPRHHQHHQRHGRSLEDARPRSRRRWPCGLSWKRARPPVKVVGVFAPETGIAGPRGSLRRVLGGPGRSRRPPWCWWSG